MKELDLILEALDGMGLTPLVALALKFFLRNRYESLCIVDNESRIEFLDQGSERFFGLKKGEAKGMPIETLVPQSSLPKIIETGIPVIGRIFEIRGKRWISSAYPLVRDGEILGGLTKLTLFSLEEVERINNEIKKLRREVTHLKEKEKTEYGKLYTFRDILGTSPQIKSSIEMAKKVSLINTDVLIFGESGTGKELLAQSIHNFASADRPFVKVNCPAIPFELAESELFGYEKGTFTGGLPSGKPGKFENANNGTIFLDEISSLPLSIQAKLLRVLQEREVERLGSTNPRSINFKLIAATNRDLKGLVKQGKFRDDLYYRVSKAIIYVPPIRERRGDISIYVDHFLNKITSSFNLRTKVLSRGAHDLLLKYDWPGNVRELINVLEQAVLRAWNVEEITETHLPDDLLTASMFLAEQNMSSNNRSLRKGVEATEKELIISVLKANNSNKRRTALELRMSRSTLYEKLRKYGISNDSLIEKPAEVSSRKSETPSE